jgi:hypothetical protein
MAINRLLDHIEAEEPAEDQRKAYKKVIVGTGKGQHTVTYTFDVDQEAADFTGHNVGCTCMDCAIYRTSGSGSLCPTCKHHRCECDENEEE